LGVNLSVPSGEVAQPWTYADGGGEIGVISSVTQAFFVPHARALDSRPMASCTPACLVNPAMIYARLWAWAGAIGLIWNQREDQYSEIRAEDTARSKKIEMSYIRG
jgi:cyclic pyranopterin phosphate synthase